MNLTRADRILCDILFQVKLSRGLKMEVKMKRGAGWRRLAPRSQRAGGRLKAERPELEEVASKAELKLINQLASVIGRHSSSALAAVGELAPG